MEPEQCFDKHLNGSDQIVPVPHVAKLMRNDALPLLGVRCSKIPSDNNRTGRNTPKTPGSKNEGEETAGMETPDSIGDPVRTAATTRRQRLHEEKATQRKPPAHTVQRTMGRTPECDAVPDTVNESAGAANGWLTC
jgi:hypothetical protein